MHDRHHHCIYTNQLKYIFILSLCVVFVYLYAYLLSAVCIFSTMVENDTNELRLFNALTILYTIRPLEYISLSRFSCSVLFNCSFFLLKINKLKTTWTTNILIQSVTYSSTHTIRLNIQIENEIEWSVVYWVWMNLFKSDQCVSNWFYLIFIFL